MTKVLYQPHTFLVKPIAKPEKISIFRHTVLFINEEDNTIERAIPDFKEVYMDSKSANIEKLDGAALSFFEIVEDPSKVSNEPVFKITVFEGKEHNPTEYNGPKVIEAKCINGYSCSLEDVIFESSMKVMRK